jgi:predicted TIM-barrel fold metal-dependent hydrolase
MANAATVMPEPSADSRIGPVTAIPDGAWDCHAHVIDAERFPLWAGRDYQPPPASLEDYLALLDRLGLKYGVLVQPSVYGFDNRCMLDALDRADGRLFGVAVPAPDSTPQQLEALHRRGIRGVRCNLLNRGGLEPETVLGWQPVLRELGCHVSFQLAVETVVLASWFERFDVPLVVDHMGRPAPGRADPSSPALSGLIDLVRDGACFVKLSAPYRLSAVPPPWPDVTPLARALLEANPSACLWATDWPHTQAQEWLPEDDLLRALVAWCPDARTREIVLRDAPVALLGGAPKAPRSS